MDNSAPAAPSLDFSSDEAVFAASDDTLPSAQACAPALAAQALAAQAPPFELLPEYEIEADSLPSNRFRSAARAVAALPAGLSITSRRLFRPILARLLKLKKRLEAARHRSGFISMPEREPPRRRGSRKRYKRHI